MGGANSRAAPATAEQIMLPLVDKVVGMAEEASAAGGSPKNVLAFAMSSLKTMDEGVMQFVSQSHLNVLQDNKDILHAYYDATQKAQSAALEVQHHAGISSTELKRLQAIALTYNTGSAASQDLALEELSRLDVEKMNLPPSLVEKLTEAMNAYTIVVNLCDKPLEDLEQTREKVGWWIGKAVGVCCLIVLAVAICAVAPPIGAAVAAVGAGAGVAVSTTAATAFALATGASIAVVGGGMAALLTKRIQELNDLAETIKVQQELLNKTKQDTEGILLAIKPLKDTVQKLRNNLQITAGSTSTAKNLHYMKEITCEKFLGSLDTQLGELESLSKSCDELCAMVNHAHDFFKSKSGFISERVRLGKDLY